MTFGRVGWVVAGLLTACVLGFLVGLARPHRAQGPQVSESADVGPIED